MYYGSGRCLGRVFRRRHCDGRGFRNRVMVHVTTGLSLLCWSINVSSKMPRASLEPERLPQCLPHSDSAGFGQASMRGMLSMVNVLLLYLADYECGM